MSEPVQLQRSRARRWLSARAAEAMTILMEAMTQCKWPGRRPTILRLFKASRDVTLAYAFALFVAHRTRIGNAPLDEHPAGLGDTPAVGSLRTHLATVLPIQLRAKGGALEVFDGLEASLDMVANVDDECIASFVELMTSLDSSKTPVVAGQNIGFQHLSEEDLGGIHELFVGHMPKRTGGPIRLVHDPSRRVSGTIYTPHDVTRHIVSKALGRHSKTPVDEILNLKILDPAVGSGAFVIQAVRWIESRVNQAVEDGEAVSDPDLSQALLLEGPNRTSEIRRILIERTIHGVDIDAAALAICRAALWLMLQPAGSDVDLSCNLVRRDSLSTPPGPRFKSVWEGRFPGTFSNGSDGFDIVIGNPPYVRAHLDRFRTADSRNLYCYFIEVGLGLLSSDGCFCMIVPISLLNSKQAKSVRSMILEEEGSVGFENFDCVPGFLFDQGKIEGNSNTNITQRTTILSLDRVGKRGVSSTRFLRWRRTAERSTLFDSITGIEIPRSLAESDRIPKVGSQRDVRLISKMLKHQSKLSGLIDDGETELWVPKAGRYFITASHIDHQRPNSVNLSSKDKASFARLHVSINSNLFYWWWRVMSNGFQVENRDVLEFPSLPITDEEAIRLSGLLIDAAEECVVYKQNAGRPIPNLNYNIRQDILQQIDEALLSSIGEPPYEELLKSKSNSLTGDLSQLRGYSEHSNETRDQFRYRPRMENKTDYRGGVQLSSIRGWGSDSLPKLLVVWEYEKTTHSIPGVTKARDLEATITDCNYYYIEDTSIFVPWVDTPNHSDVTGWRYTKERSDELSRLVDQQHREYPNRIIKFAKSFKNGQGTSATCRLQYIVSKHANLPKPPTEMKEKLWYKELETTFEQMKGCRIRLKKKNGTLLTGRRVFITAEILEMEHREKRRLQNEEGYTSQRASEAAKDPGALFIQRGEGKVNCIPDFRDGRQDHWIGFAVDPLMHHLDNSLQMSSPGSIGHDFLGEED